MTFWTSERRQNHYGLTALPAACVGPRDRQFFMGGVALAAAIEAMEREFEKPLLWATIQFLSHGRLGETIEIQVEPESGNNIQQAGAVVRSGNRVLQRVMSALGQRESAIENQFAEMPTVLPPQECPEKPFDSFGMPGNLLDQFERRTALQDDTIGIKYLWFKPKFETPVSASLLALIADFLLGAHSETQGGTSLDNTFRVHSLASTTWVLNAVQITGIKNGAAHGTVRQFAEDGTLLASGSQTGLLPRR